MKVLSTTWLLKKLLGEVTSVDWRADRFAGYQPISWTPMCRLWALVRYHWANSFASAGCLVPVMTAIEEPPHIEVTFWPAVHCGMGATAHWPAVSLASLVTTPWPQTAETQL